MSFRKASIVFIICAAATLTGCASISYPLPKCDGGAKRPLNRSMWQWQQEKAAVSGPRADASTNPVATPLGYASLATPTSDQPAFAGFDEAGSHRACGTGRAA